MAKALVKSVDFIHPDPDIDRTGAHKRGDIIVVKPDSHVWGGAELDTNKFVIVDVPDTWLTDANGYTESLQESKAQIIPKSAKKKARMARLIAKVKERKTLKRHRWSVDLDGANTLIDHRSE